MCVVRLSCFIVILLERDEEGIVRAVFHDTAACMGGGNEAVCLYSLFLSCYCFLILASMYLAAKEHTGWMVRCCCAAYCSAASIRREPMPRPLW